MINIPDEKPSFSATPAPSSEKGGRLRDIMDRVGASLGIIKLHKAPLDPALIQKCKEIDEILEDLAGVKEEFTRHHDQELLAHVTGIINPMERHLRKIKKKLEEKGPLEAGEGWVVKAKVWTQLKGKPLHRAAIMSHLILHVRDEVETSIQQDFQVIKVYLYHRMDAMKLSHEERKAIEEKLEEPLEILGNEVRNLTTFPAEATLKALTDWRAEIDRKRQKHHEDALELINRHLPKNKSN